jgi:hypothetical protein
MKIVKLVLVSFIATAALAGCSDAEEFEVAGEVTAAQAVAGPISLEFFELDGSDTEAERESVLQVELAELGAFTQMVEVSPDNTIIAHALVDDDGDGACSAGELWAEAEVTPNDDGTVDAIALALTAGPCPAP